MANECLNYISIKGDKELLQIFADSYLVKNYNNDTLDFTGDSLINNNYNYDLDFNIIVPIPEDCENDYDYRIHNWGNKWDGTNGYVTFWRDDEIFIDVTTAWSPCEPIVEKLINLCPGLYFYHEYYEGGMGFVGWREHQPGDDPDDDERIDYSYEDKENYWYTVFDKEFESIEWLADVIEDSYTDEEISEQEYEELQQSLENDELCVLVEMCVEKGVLR